MKIIAHRAGTDRYPEQSLASIRHSLELGADYAEVDVRFTKDAVPVICHDTNVQRVFGVDADVSALTLNEFLSLRYNDDISMSAYSLSQLLETCASRLLLHCKRCNPQEIHVILEMLKKYDGDIIIGVTSTDAVGQIKDYGKQILTLAFMKTEEELDCFLDTDVDIIRLWERWVTKERVDVIHRADKQCWVMSGFHKNPGYTVPENMELWRGMGVDGVLINEIEPLKLQ